MNKVEKVAKEILAGKIEVRHSWVSRSGLGLLMATQELNKQYGTPIKEIQKIAKSLVTALKKEADKIHKDLNLDGEQYKVVIRDDSITTDVFNGKVRALMDVTANKDYSKDVGNYIGNKYRRGEKG